MQIDAGKVNIPGGWRDVKVVAFAASPRGPASSAGDPESQDLPAPSARSVGGGGGGGVGVRGAEALRLGSADPARPGESGPGVSVLGDGAECVWGLADRELAGAGPFVELLALANTPERAEHGASLAA